MMRPERILLVALGIAVVAFSWTMMDAPEDTGVHVHGIIRECFDAFVPRIRSPYTCTVQLDNARDVTVMLPSWRAGRGITLAVQVHRFSGRIAYNSLGLDP